MKESKIFSERNLTEKVNYVYRVTIDDKYYIGKRTGRLNDLETGVYKTSSKLVHEKLQNGMTFSKIKILQVFPTAKDALDFESRILTRVDAKANPKFLNQTNGGDGDFTCKQHTEKSKAKISKTKKAQFDENTDRGRKLRENTSENRRKFWDENTEQGRKRRENHSEKMKEYYSPETEEGRFHIEENRRRGAERFNPETEQGRFHIEENRRRGAERFNPDTEEGRRNRENASKGQKERHNPDTEEGIKRRENKSQSAQAQFDINTEEGRRNREHFSEIQRNNWDKNTEEGRKRRENHSEFMKEKAKEQLQKRKDASVLGELMFDEAFIKENFLITDNKNNQRFLWSVYSKLTGFKKSSIIEQKREGKLNFLYGIESISITEELENSKIREIEAIIKSRNN